MSSIRWPITLALCSLSLAAGCGDDPVATPLGDAGKDVTTVDNGTPVDTGRDTGVDTGRDAGPDAGQITDTGATKDAGDDAGTPVDTGLPTDTGDDAGSPVDAGIDAGMDAGTDAGPVGDVGPVADQPAVDVPVPVDVPVDAPPVCPTPRGVITLPSATPIALTGTTTGTGVLPSNRCQSNTGGPEAVYTLVVTARTGVILSTDNEGTTFDTSISIRGLCADATTEVSCDDDSGSGTGRSNSSVLRAVLAPGTYTVIVDGYSATATTNSGTYALTAATFTPGANASCDMAQVLTANTPVTAQTLTDVGVPGVCAPGTTPGGQRFYTVMVPATTVATFVLTRATGSWTPVLRVLDQCSSTSCIASVSSSSSPVTLNFNNLGATPQGVVLTVAASASDATVTPYDLVMNTAPYVAGQACEQPIAVAAGATLAAQNAATGRTASGACLTSSANGGQLFYSVTLAAGANATVRAVPAGAMAAWTPTLRLINACDATACRDSNTAAASGGAAALTLRNGATGTQAFLLSVSGTSATAGTFNLEVGPATVPAVGYTREAIAAVCDDMTTGAAVPSTATGGAYSDDSTSAIADLPFSVPFFGEARTRFSVNSNGLLSLYAAAGGSTTTAYSNTFIPTPETPNGFVAALWDDLLPVASTAAVRSATFGTGSARRFVVQWSDFRFASPDDAVRLRFQAKLFETTGVIEIHYCDLTASNARASGATATIGVENGDGTLGTQVSNNTAGAATTGSGYRLTPR